MLNGMIIFMGGGLGSLARGPASGYVVRQQSETFPPVPLCFNGNAWFLGALVAGRSGRCLPSETPS